MEALLDLAKALPPHLPELRPYGLEVFLLDGLRDVVVHLQLLQHGLPLLVVRTLDVFETFGHYGVEPGDPHLLAADDQMLHGWLPGTTRTAYLWHQLRPCKS